MPTPRKMNNDAKITKIALHIKEIMKTLELDLTNDSLKGTPLRVAKMYVNEIFNGLDPENFPSISLFKNSFGYHQMLIEKNIPIFSTCEHHLMPVIGKVSIAYFAEEKIIGLSKIHRIVKHFTKRPQVQERLTVEIGQSLQNILKTKNIAVYIEAEHLCIAARGIENSHSSTTTYFLEGKFKELEVQNQFLNSIK